MSSSLLLYYLGYVGSGLKSHSKTFKKLVLKKKVESEVTSGGTGEIRFTR